LRSYGWGGLGTFAAGAEEKNLRSGQREENQREEKTMFAVHFELRSAALKF
jgi:hypothetical protein